MDLESIPKSFWHSLSFAVLVLTIGTVVVTYKTGNLTLKYKDFEFATANAQTQISEAQKKVQDIVAARDEEIANLTKDRDLLLRTVADAQKQLSLLQANAGRNSVENSGKVEITVPKLQSVAVDKQLAESIKKRDDASIQKHIENLSRIQETIKQQAKW